MKKVIATIMSMLVITQASHAIEKIEAKGKVNAVTLFRGQALVTRTVPIEAGAGSIQLTIKDLPPSIQGHSLFVNAGDDLKVRAVRYHTSATGKAPKEEVQELDDKIAAIEKKPSMLLLAAAPPLIGFLVAMPYFAIALVLQYLRRIMNAVEKGKQP